MDSLFAKKDFSILADVAAQITQQRSQIAYAWRYIGIKAILNGENGKQSLQKAAVLGGIEANDWLNTLSEFDYHNI